MAAKRGLGRGLNSLIPTDTTDEASPKKKEEKDLQASKG